MLPDGVDTDVFGIEHDELAAAVQQFVVRGGRVRGVRSWVVDKELDIPLGELVESVLEAAYENEEPPREIIVPALPDDARALETWLAGMRPRGGAVALRTAQRGDKASVLETATLNAKQALMLYKTRRTADYVARTQALNDIQDALGLDEAPLRMECYDVSHLGGTNIVASMVVFEDGLPKKSAYRKFAVAGYADDTEALSQVLRRRLAHLDEEPESAEELGRAGGRGRPGRRPTDSRRSGKRFAYRPGLLIVDGGQPQVEAAARTLRELGIDDIPVCGLAKRLEEIWLPGQDFPVILPRNSEALFLMQRIRDEAHRFAITFQRQKRRGDIGTVLAEVPGLGPARSKELLRHFGSVARLKARERRPRSPKCAASGPHWRPPSSLGWELQAPSLQGSRTQADERQRDARDAHRHGHVGRRSLHRRPTPSRTSAGTSSTTCRRRCSDRSSTSPSTPATPSRRSPRSSTSAAASSSPTCRRPSSRCGVNANVRVVFLDASDAVLVRRFEQVRRPHPLQGDGTLLDGIVEERNRMSGLRSQSDVVIDTSDLNIHQLAVAVGEQFGGESRSRPAAHAAELRVQVRPAGRRRHGRRHALPAEPVLGSRAGAADRSRRGGPRLRARAARSRGVHRRLRGGPRAGVRRVPSREQETRYDRLGMHGRQAPLRRRRRGARSSAPRASRPDRERQAP